MPGGGPSGLSHIGFAQANSFSLKTRMFVAKFLRFALKAQEARLIHAFTQNQP